MRCMHCTGCRDSHSKPVIYTVCRCRSVHHPVQRHMSLLGLLRSYFYCSNKLSLVIILTIKSQSAFCIFIVLFLEIHSFFRVIKTASAFEISPLVSFNFNSDLILFSSVIVFLVIVYVSDFSPPSQGIQSTLDGSAPHDIRHQLSVLTQEVVYVARHQGGG